MFKVTNSFQALANRSDDVRRRANPGAAAFDLGFESRGFQFLHGLLITLVIPGLRAIDPVGDAFVEGDEIVLEWGA